MSQLHLGDFFTNRQEPGLPGLPVMSVTMNDSLVLRDDLDRRTESALRPDQHLLVRKGDIAYNMMRMWQGACGLAEADGIVSPAYVVLQPKPNINSQFAYHWFKSARMIYLFWAYSHGLTEDRLRLYFESFAEIPAAPPALEQQQKIADILDKWDQAICQTERLIAAKRKRFDRILWSTIGIGKSRQHQSKDWSQKELGDLVSFKSGGTPNRANASYWGGDIPWVSAKDLKVFEVDSSLETLTAAGAAKVNEAPAGAILLLVRGMGLFRDIPIGVAKRRIAFNQDIKALVPKALVLPKFLAYALRAKRHSIMDRVESAGHGTGRLSTSFLEALPVAFPDIATQGEVVKLLDSAEYSISASVNYLSQMRIQKREVMRKLLADGWRLGRNAK
ncbi:restriction endonuclease subunit S [Xanthobacter variabilis]|uniref:restriction endonuclease subunit S n=1 Tax=Xanthobacter variabilis TaxID=3119932 RepID=UPI00372A8216